MEGTKHRGENLLRLVKVPGENRQGASYHYKSHALLLEQFSKYRVIQNDCPEFNNLSYTIHLR